MITRSPKFKQVKTWFDLGVWDAEKVHSAVDKGWITEEEYREIVGGDGTS